MKEVKTMRETFRFFNTDEEADRWMKSRGRRKSWKTPWTSDDGKEKKVVVWYFE